MIVVRGLGRGVVAGALVAFGLTLDGRPYPPETKIYNGRQIQSINLINRDDEEVLLAVAFILRSM